MPRWFPWTPDSLQLRRLALQRTCAALAPASASADQLLVLAASLVAPLPHQTTQLHQVLSDSMAAVLVGRCLVLALASAARELVLELEAAASVDLVAVVLGVLATEPVVASPWVAVAAATEAARHLPRAAVVALAAAASAVDPLRLLHLLPPVAVVPQALTAVARLRHLLLTAVASPAAASEAVEALLHLRLRLVVVASLVRSGTTHRATRHSWA